MRFMKITVFLLTVVMAAHFSWGASGTTKVVSKGQLAQREAGWPEGALKLINDPLRRDGWHSWFSECPNDSTYYTFDVRDFKDVDQLVELLASLQAKTLRINLDPTEGAAHAEGVGALFLLGNQRVVDEWYKSLPEVEAGVRAFGVHRYREPPLAEPPTLTLYVQHEAVDLNRLEIPLNIDLTTATAKPFRELHQDAFQEIDEFVAAHKAKQERFRQAKIKQK